MATILRQTSLLLAILAVLAGLCLPLALSQQHTDLASGLAMTGLASAFIALVLISALPSVPSTPMPPRRRDGLILVLIFWLLVPLMASLPFLTSAVSPSMVSAWFEAISNLTTTGASAGPDHQPDAILLWRTCLQWFGGTVSTAAAIAIFAEFASSAAGSVHNRAPYSVGLRVFIPSILLCGSIYLGAAILTMLAMTIKGVSMLEAAEAAMALVTTSTSLSGIVPGHNVLPLIPALALLIGATNIRSLAKISTSGTKAWRNDPESPAFIICVLLIAGLLALWAGQADVRLLFEVLSYMATSGMSLAPAHASTPILPQPVPEFLTLIGGCALSTAGGLKIVRILALSDKVWQDMNRLAYANTVSRVGGERNPAIVGTFIYLSAFTGAMGLLLLILSATGIDTLTAYRTTMGMLTNTGPLLSAGLSPSTEAPILLIFSLGCVLGRMEILALAPLLTRDAWR